MDVLKRYVDVYVPVEACSLRCHYCYITTHRLFSAKLPEFKYKPDHVRKALSRQRMGGICFFSFCGGGETLLPPELPKYFLELLREGHYVGVVTNGTITRAIDEIENFPKELIRRMFFKFSYHHLELINHNLQSRFFENVRRMKNAGAAITVEITPDDKLIPYIDDIKNICEREVGAWPHVSVARDEREMSVLPILTELSREDYNKVWSSFDSELFRFKMSVFGKRQPFFCYAGDWTFNLDLGSGVMRQCYFSLLEQNIFEDVDRPIIFKAIGHSCMEPHCHNAHVFLGYGDMPEINDTTYAKERNRMCVDGSEWLNDEFKSIMGQRLCDNHPRYNEMKKCFVDFDMQYIKLKKRIRGVLSCIKHRIARWLRRDNP